MRSRSYINALPTAITLTRILAVPLVLWLIIDSNFVMAFWVFAYASVSDAIDGALARFLDARTELGAYLDPIADKLLLVSVYVSLGLQHFIPIWLVILVAFRDLLIIGGVVMFQTADRPLAMIPTVISKVNSLLQFILATWSLAAVGFGWDYPMISSLLVYTVATTTVLSGVVYVIRSLRSESQIIK
ncbi:MAG: CDP-alcohol phosphatidyltransferase family protein [Candidatus Pacebacteria bacterium]|nr:CDP-alcohol phosphatidyltransferase family protein [Candidatus Paceibacterota bacterium]